MRPSFGQQIAWGESNAIAFANSVIGARTERYPDLLDICCAIAGRVPAVGLHLTENRGGQMLLRLRDVPPALQQDDQFFAVLGHLVGKLAEDRIPVIDGLVVQPPEDQLKAFSAAVASSGRVALFHLVGITPEAPTLAAAFQHRAPQTTHDISVDDLRDARRELTTADGTELDMVILGSPHFSVAEFKRLAPLVEGRATHPRVKFLVTSSRLMKELAQEAGVLAPIRRLRRADHARYLHSRLADAAGIDQDADDELGEVRLLRALAAQYPHYLRQPGGLCSVRGRRSRNPRRFRLAG